jgi:hypothetical protein
VCVCVECEISDSSIVHLSGRGVEREEGTMKGIR